MELVNQKFVEDEKKLSTLRMILRTLERSGIVASHVEDIT
jgi:hypothetical protein